MAETVKKAANKTTATMSRKSSDAEVRALLEKADEPMTAAEIATRLGRSSSSDTATIAKRIGAARRMLDTTANGRRPFGWALDKDVLAKRRGDETATRKPKSKPRKRPATKRSAAAKKRAAAPATRSNVDPRPERFERTPYITGDGSLVLADPAGNLYAARPLVVSGPGRA